MKFTPEKYRIEDIAGRPFIDPAEINELLQRPEPDLPEVLSVLDKAAAKQRLSMSDVATLICARGELNTHIFSQANALKERVYGNRIVLFAPLYVGSKCTNNCQYCGFRVSNKEALRHTLSGFELIREVEALQDQGQKRLILVFGEHPDYSPEFIADTVKLVYSIKKGQGEIRRVNINAAPMDVDGFRVVGKSGIGTYQIFQETYHPEAYSLYHPSGRKQDFDYRLTALDRAMEAGIDDVGIGALFGLYPWQYELMALVRHTNHLEACFNVGPHTISFPRLQEAAFFNKNGSYQVSDADFMKLIAILRLAVPYTGLILTARESEAIRNEAIRYGVSQIDGGTKIEMGAYSAQKTDSQNLNREQFRISDDRSLNEVIDELLNQGQLPSFCTACYRRGRTGEHFMEFSVPGFIKRFCSPNAILTLAEYLTDYAPEDTRTKGWRVIDDNLNELSKVQDIAELQARLQLVREGKRDIYF